MFKFTKNLKCHFKNTAVETSVATNVMEQNGPDEISTVDVGLWSKPLCPCGCSWIKIDRKKNPPFECFNFLNDSKWTNAVVRDQAQISVS